MAADRSRRRRFRVIAALAVCGAVAAGGARAADAGPGPGGGPPPGPTPPAPVAVGGVVAGAAVLAPRPAAPVRPNPEPRATLVLPDDASPNVAPLPSLKSGRNGPGTSSRTIRARLHALDRQADRGTLSLEEYRVLRDQILRGY